MGDMTKMLALGLHYQAGFFGANNKASEPRVRGVYWTTGKIWFVMSSCPGQGHIYSRAIEEARNGRGGIFGWANSMSKMTGSLVWIALARCSGGVSSGWSAEVSSQCKAANGRRTY